MSHIEFVCYKICASLYYIIAEFTALGMFEIQNIVKYSALTAF